ncbi:ADP-ribosylglycohydrolase family protein [Fontivita pretiosa]|uniref:ADP-ribosylglycohydrolase family protein n=1 Tax=Fontivita pretiosa TaxID=2989684 RepID=UPI003D173009
MLPPLDLLRQSLKQIIIDKQRQGHVTSGLNERLDGLPDSYDAMADFARELARLPMRPDWRFVEPNALDEIWAECDPNRATGPIASVDVRDIAPRVETAFLSAVCGCILGKPLEVRPTLEQIRAAASAVGEWPLNDYVSEAMLAALGRRHNTWAECVRGRIAYAAPDDDINYKIAGMLLLEQFGRDLSTDHVRQFWFVNFPAGWQWGPERTLNVRAAMWSMRLPQGEKPPLEEWVSVLNPRDEYCGALIRADAYGYACPGHPALAAELAWRDASYTHRRTGIYGTMFTAAAIATAFVARDWEQIFRVAVQYVPRRSRFAEVVQDSIEQVRQASDWLDGYARIHNKYREYDHCQIYQEIGTVINTLRFARDIGQGICMQVSQGNDTDSFGATAGSILGAFHGPGKLEPRWLAPFNDRIHCTVAMFHEHRLSEVARRMGALPARVLNG